MALKKKVTPVVKNTASAKPKKEGLLAVFDKFPDTVGLHPEFKGPGGYPLAMFQWSLKGVGFGELVFYQKGKKLMCDNECMSRERVKYILCLLADQATLRDPEPGTVKAKKTTKKRG